MKTDWGVAISNILKKKRKKYIIHGTNLKIFLLKETEWAFRIQSILMQYQNVKHI